MARNRFNRKAICSSGDYRRSRKDHLSFLKERHQHFNEITINGEILIDTPILDRGLITSTKYKTIRVFGKEMKISIDEYDEHCAHLGL